MFRHTLFALVVVALYPLAAAAVDSKLEVTVVQTKEGAQVSAVTDGGVGKALGFQKGDSIVAYSFNGEKPRAIKAPADMKELLAGTTGKYEIEVRRSGGGTETLRGSVAARKDGKLYFVAPRK